MKTVLVLTCLLGISLANEIFSYDAIEHKHSQKGEAGSAVQGEYTFTGPDGKEYTITYKADDNGYVAQGDHLPVAPEVPVVEAAPAADPVPEPPAPAVAEKSAEEPATSEEAKPGVPSGFGYSFFNPVSLGVPYPYLFRGASDAELKPKIQVVQSPFVFLPPSPFVYRVGA